MFRYILLQHYPPRNVNTWGSDCSKKDSLGLLGALGSTLGDCLASVQHLTGPRGKKCQADYVAHDLCPLFQFVPLPDLVQYHSNICLHLSLHWERHHTNVNQSWQTYSKFTQSVQRKQLNPSISFHKLPPSSSVHPASQKRQGFPPEQVQLKINSSCPYMSVLCRFDSSAPQEFRDQQFFFWVVMLNYAMGFNLWLRFPVSRPQTLTAVAVWLSEQPPVWTSAAFASEPAHDV